MKCKFCGMINSEEAIFCSSCGKQVNTDICKIENYDALIRHANKIVNEFDLYPLMPRGDLSIDFIISCKVVNPPNKWKEWDKVYVKIDFSFVKNLSWQGESVNFLVQTFIINKTQSYEAELKDICGSVLIFNFEAARVQNVKPLIYKEEYGRYEVY